MKKLIQKWNSINLIKRIICGLIVGIILGLAIPQASVTVSYTHLTLPTN